MDDLASQGRANFPSLGNSPELVDAFLVLLGKRPPPPHTDKVSYLRHCQAVLEDAVDRFEIQRQGNSVFWPYPRPADTNIHSQKAATDNHVLSLGRDPLLPSTSR